MLKSMLRFMDRTTEGRQRRRAKGSKGHERTFSKDLEVSYSDHDSFTSNLPFPLKVSRLANTALSTFMYCTAQNRKTKTSEVARLASKVKY